MKEKLTPPTKSVASSGGVKDGANSTTTTPKNDVQKWWGKKGDGKNSIMK